MNNFTNLEVLEQNFEAYTGLFIKKFFLYFPYLL